MRQLGPDSAQFLFTLVSDQLAFGDDAKVIRKQLLLTFDQSVEELGHMLPWKFQQTHTDHAGC